MKTIKSALLGTKSLIDTNPEVLLVQLKEILKAHRELIINRLMGDVPTYLDYKFNVKADKKMVELVKDRLLDLKKSNADLDAYDSIVQQVLNRSVTHLTNEPFYVEIDEYLSQYVKPQQLKFVS
ncbi:MAG TPA: hypothetical protein PKJ83_18415 [Cyclobacteriaceae bacterium]|nr:hypothetical protein [Cyclobacteriaceae bacterium]HPW62787.1 hypothetical protein [Cyclobacteriaceae bacterium]